MYLPRKSIQAGLSIFLIFILIIMTAAYAYRAGVLTGRADETGGTDRCGVVSITWLLTKDMPDYVSGLEGVQENRTHEIEKWAYQTFRALGVRWDLAKHNLKRTITYKSRDESGQINTVTEGPSFDQYEYIIKAHFSILGLTFEKNVEIHLKNYINQHQEEVRRRVIESARRLGLEVDPDKLDLSGYGFDGLANILGEDWLDSTIIKAIDEYAKSENIVLKWLDPSLRWQSCGQRETKSNPTSYL